LAESGFASGLVIMAQILLEDKEEEEMRRHTKF
jgi:hypothetical protein